MNQLNYYNELTFVYILSMKLNSTQTDNITKVFTRSFLSTGSAPHCLYKSKISKVSSAKKNVILYSKSYSCFLLMAFLVILL